MTLRLVVLAFLLGSPGLWASESVESARKARDIAYQVYTRELIKAKGDQATADRLKGTIIRASERRLARAIQNENMGAFQKKYGWYFAKRSKVAQAKAAKASPKPKNVTFNPTDIGDGEEKPVTKKRETAPVSSGPAAGPAVPKTGAELIEYKGKKK